MTTEKGSNVNTSAKSKQKRPGSLTKKRKRTHKKSLMEELLKTILSFFALILNHFTPTSENLRI